jgi:hypothetical protein
MLENLRQGIAVAYTLTACTCLLVVCSVQAFGCITHVDYAYWKQVGNSAIALQVGMWFDACYQLSSSASGSVHKLCQVCSKSTSRTALTVTVSS